MSMSERINQLLQETRDKRDAISDEIEKLIVKGGDIRTRLTELEDDEYKWDLVAYRLKCVLDILP